MKRQMEVDFFYNNRVNNEILSQFLNIACNSVRAR